MKIKFRGLSAELVAAVATAFKDCPEWDVQQGDIFTGIPADILVSPANCTGRMDGGIDQVYINRFGWQLEARLMRDIRTLHGGRLPIGEARLITTYDEELPLMACAPTMDWPPGDVSSTENAYLAFAAVLRVASTEGVRALGRQPVILMPGLCTLTGRMLPQVFAMQARRAWDEFKRDAAAPAPSQAEPVLFQVRMRPTWREDGKGWTPWEECTAESARDYERTPVLHDWQYEVRRLYAAPAPGASHDDQVGFEQFDSQFSPGDEPSREAYFRAGAKLAASASPAALTDEREAFESWAKARTYNIGQLGGVYAVMRTVCAWDGWLGRAQLAASPDDQGEDARDAKRYRWLCAGNGYFMEENDLCGHRNEKAEADAAIDAAMSARRQAASCSEWPCCPCESKTDCQNGAKAA